MNLDSGKEKPGLEDLFAADLELDRNSLSSRALSALAPADQVKLCITDDNRLHVWKGEPHADYFKKLNRSGQDSVGVLLSGNMFRPKRKDMDEIIEGEIHIEFNAPDPAFASAERPKSTASHAPLRSAVLEYLKKNVEPGKNVRWVAEFFEHRPEVIDPRTRDRH